MNDLRLVKLKNKRVGLAYTKADGSLHVWGVDFCYPITVEEVDCSTSIPPDIFETIAKEAIHSTKDTDGLRLVKLKDGLVGLAYTNADGSLHIRGMNFENNTPDTKVAHYICMEDLFVDPDKAITRLHKDIAVIRLIEEKAEQLREMREYSEANNALKIQREDLLATNAKLAKEVAESAHLVDNLARMARDCDNLRRELNKKDDVIIDRNFYIETLNRAKQNLISEHSKHATELNRQIDALRHELVKQSEKMAVAANNAVESAVAASDNIAKALLEEKDKEVQELRLQIVDLLNATKQMPELKQTVEDRGRIIKALQQNISDITASKRSIHDGYLQQIAGLNRGMEKRQKEIQDLNENIKFKAVCIRDLEGKVVKLQEQVASNQELQDLREVLIITEVVHNKKIKELQDEVIGCNRDIEGLKIALQQVVLDKGKTIGAQQDMIVDLTQKLGHEKVVVKLQDDRILKLVNLSNNKQAQIDDLIQRLRQENRAVGAEINKTVDLEERVTELSKQLEFKNTAMKGQEDYITKQYQAISQLEERLKIHEQSIKELNLTIENLSAVVFDKQMAIDNLNNIIAQQQQAMEELQKTTAEATAKEWSTHKEAVIKQLQDKLSKYVQEIAALREDTAHKQDTISNLGKEIARLQDLVCTRNRESLKFEAEIKQLKVRVKCNTEQEQQAAQAIFAGYEKAVALLTGKDLITGKDV